MDKNRFGKIVRSLRLERFNEELGHPWRQEELAQASGISLNTIRNIEQGRRATLQADELEQLANALALSPPETLEFFAVASEATVHKAIPDHETSPVVDLFWQAATVRLPAYIVDPFSTLLAANGSMMALGGYDLPTMDDYLSAPVGVNVMDMLFHPDAPIQQPQSERWRQVSITTLHFFRMTVLRFRYLPQFEILIDHLQGYSLFAELWRSSRTHAPALRTLAPSYHYHHPAYGTLRYMRSFLTHYSDSWPHYMLVLLPLDAHTGDIFHQLDWQEDYQWYNPRPFVPAEGEFQ